MFGAGMDKILKRRVRRVSLNDMKIMTRRFALSSLLLIALWHLLWARYDFVSSNYFKYEYRIPMRDGKELFTAVYVPKENTRAYPIMLKRTPYGVGPYGIDNYPSSLGPSSELAEDGFIFAYQDVRGRMMSEGEFVNLTPYKKTKTTAQDVDESSDAYDTIDWLLRNIPNNNGKVGIWGISYPAFYAASAMIDAHPALRAVSPQAPIADWFIGDDFHHNGAFYLAHSFGFLASFGHPRSEPTTRFGRGFHFPTLDGYDFYLRMGPLPQANEKYLKNKIPFWNEIMRHGTYDDFWQARNYTRYLRDIQFAVMTVGGWFDAEDLYGTLSVYQSVESLSPDAYNIIVMGPWYHGAWARSDGNHLGNARFGSDTSAFYREKIEFPFFRYFLKGAGELNLPEAYVFLTGSNEWRREDRWPPRKAREQKLYFCKDWTLSWTPDSGNPEDSFDEYISDPDKPVPYINGIAMGMTREHMVGDQRFASRRTDVLTYSTEAHQEDIVIAGPVAVSLSVSTTGTDSDFVVKLIDMYPDDSPDNEPDPEGVPMGGFQQLVRGEVFRGKFRSSYSNPEPFVPGEITQIEYRMPDIFHTFRKGHRIMVQVQSSWFPLVDRNPQQFVDIYKAKAEDFIKATQRIYRSRKAPSFIILNRIK
jgi:putative CocE/NonD family hydrolase